MAESSAPVSWTLKVSVLKAENISSSDYWSETDSYVTLHLPAVSSRVFRTTIAPNNKNPEWNQTFTFNVKDRVQGILEVRLYDEDPLKYDDLLWTLSVDISTLSVGEKTTKMFRMEPQGKLWLDFHLQKSISNPISRPEGVRVKKEAVSYQTLNVTVVRATIPHSQDFYSGSDCYVILSLPTATARKCRTKTVSNTDHPVWDQVFSYRLPERVKSVLEIQLYDEDRLSRDDHISTLLFDLSNLTVGQKETKVFEIDPEVGKTLVLDLELLQRDDPPLEYLSNGIVMAPPFTALEVNSEQLQHHSDKVVQVRGAYQEIHSVSSKLRYHINRDLSTELGVTPVGGYPAEELESAVPLKPLPPKYSAKVSLLIDEETVDLDLETRDSEEEFLAVRVEVDIPQQEKAFLDKRKLMVTEALRKLLGPDVAADPDELPTIAVVGSGGGSRAMTCLLGHLKALQDIGLLDAVSYITGVSGSTWAMASLYQDALWSQKNLPDQISLIKKQMTKSFMGLFSPEKLYYYREELAAKRDSGFHVSIIDMAALMLENLVFGNKTISLLSEQQMSVNEGQNPYPIYTAINVRDGPETEAEWCEFTPYEVGIPKYGAFVQTENFGSQFFLGHIVKKLPEIRLPYLLGMFSSVISVNLTQLWKRLTGYDPTWSPWVGPDISNIEVDTETPALDTVGIQPMSDIGSMLTNFLKNRPAVAEAFNYLRGLFLHKDYSKHKHFQAWKETHPDAFPNHMTPHDPTLHLVDAGHDINIGCIPVLRPERNVDLILSLSYAWEPQKFFKVMRRTAAYCKDHGIPFPIADFDGLEKEPQQELYVLEDEDNPDAPVVIHMPLVNVSYKDFKSPGVRRETEEELQAGLVDVSTSDSPYTTLNFTYSPQDYDALVQLMSYNMLNNKDKILETVRRVMEKKKSKRQR
ncbi:cytosolic phospholipase A2 delta [Synchiropus splendidus]|uniref:cytosolic phospholipase A2 delta n=1 Tax=Synchiropus splendidus TaxID=270530 RepID=UPI00237E10D2|nr:cytosolic phospholipase A2 delta [Synchiropus splendidus]XP_053732057.1 cytosolic phospholipase A2 delta [Synchiropus splendidus]XP_053732058.1 cytosolic phospholipase A2 delta [Synchiropus splendidus]XP_053732059.1 cytosolic phospholipase A2 delta [Synchiropus splendidus]